MKFIIALLFAITIFAILLSNQTNVSASELNSIKSKSSAKCAIPDFQRAYKNSQAVFAGKVLSERKEGDEKIFTIKVEKYWKGIKSKTVEVRYYETMRYAAWLQVGGKYLIYAYKNEKGTLSDGRCSLTKNYSAAKDDLKRLARGKSVR